MSSVRAHRTITAVAVLITATGVSVAGSSVASAHRGVYDSATCEESLTRIWDWPGEIPTETGRIVVFSDAYESYLLRQSPCDAPPDTTPRRDEGRVGHQHPVGSDPAAG
jgi:hypothetical protein